MHILDMLEYGHQMVLDTLADADAALVEVTGACGEWSIKDIVAHLASFEAITLDAIASLSPYALTPTLDRWLASPDTFNDSEVENRRTQPMSAIVAEYTEYHHLVLDQLIHTPPAKLQVAGGLDWYGAAYDVEDFLVYTNYAHKREHCAQIAAFLDRYKLHNGSALEALALVMEVNHDYQ
jgi:hypothetical protein